MRYAIQNHEENVHTHHDDVMADARPDLQPAAVVTHQEKKVLKGKIECNHYYNVITLQLQ